MNVSGINIHVGNPMAQNSSTWSILNIFVTPIPPNPTNTQMHVSEGPESTPEISSKANPQSKFPLDFLLNPGLNPVVSQDPFGQSKQKTINILSGSQIWHLKESDERFESLPLVHEAKVTGPYHPSASKPRTAHASSSRGQMVDDDDESMSLNQSETNDDPRRDNFMVHEEGTQSNSELTKPQMPITQNMLEQFKVRQQRNQAFKVHNVVKCASQKEKKRWLKAEIPENVHGMRSAVHAHCLFLLKVRDNNFSSLPAPPSTEENEIAIQVDGHLGYVPEDVFIEPSSPVQSQGFQSYFKNELHRLGLK
ncbi:hypothetical protein O181_025211 [Austropuccinia psidii MF-1]|uniref:Uncharacterized protein n=1 Tax=Austropuccinia psidii MF-1 TaxID=1389203 RepID=A0A9Q3CMZ2_9BASI|nr:hypothetical protein [Austropuccinia psidii MF-1]